MSSKAKTILKERGSCSVSRCTACTLLYLYTVTHQLRSGTSILHVLKVLYFSTVCIFMSNAFKPFSIDFGLIHYFSRNRLSMKLTKPMTKPCSDWTHNAHPSSLNSQRIRIMCPVCTGRYANSYVCLLHVSSARTNDSECTTIVIRVSTGRSKSAKPVMY